MDLVLESGRKLLPVEVKASGRVRGGDARHLRSFLDDYPGRARFGLILHGGEKAFVLTRRVVALPVSAFL